MARPKSKTKKILFAVEIIPTPNGFVSINLSPTLHPLF